VHLILNSPQTKTVGGVVTELENKDWGQRQWQVRVGGPFLPALPWWIHAIILLKELGKQISHTIFYYITLWDCYSKKGKFVWFEIFKLYYSCHF